MKPKTSRIIERMKIEVRRRLGICQFYLYFNSKAHFVSKEASQIIITKNEICVDSELLSTGLAVIPDSLCCLTYSENVLSFRIRIDQDTVSSNISSSSVCIITSDYPECGRRLQ